MDLSIFDGLGFNIIKEIKTTDLVFDSEFRKYCKDDYCGNYGVNYACPPDCGTPEEMKEQALAYKNVIVFYRAYRLDDIMDRAAVKKVEADNRERMKKVIGIMESQTKNKSNGETTCDSFVRRGRASVIGSCHNCDICNKVKALPCKEPDKIYSCLSAYCVNVAELAKACNMPYVGGNHIYGIFGAYFY